MSPRKPRTLKEKIDFQSRQLILLKAELAHERTTLEQRLLTGGEFRKGETLDEKYLVRWLRARSWKVDKAADAIRQHATWRLTYCHKGRIQIDEIKNELEAEKIYLQGLDNEGRAVIIVLVEKHSVYKRAVDEVERMICYTIDRQLDAADTRLNPERKVTAFFDLTKLSFVSLDLTAMIRVCAMLADHFVERLGKLYIYNAPFIFWAAWKGFSPIIPRESQEKFHFIYEKDLPLLHNEIPKSILPERYEGAAEWIPIQDYTMQSRK